MKRLMRWAISPVGLSCLYLLISAVVPNNKTLFIAATLYFFALLITQKSIHKTLLYAFFPFSITNVGQTYSIEIVPSYIMSTLDPAYLEGRKLLFVFAPISLLYICSLSYIPFIFFRKKPIILSWIFFFLLLYSLFLILSSFQSNFYPAYSILYTIERIGAICWSILFILVGKKQYQETVRAIILILIVIILYEGSIVAFQAITLRPLGIFYENNLFIPNTSDDSSIMRPAGFRNHPNGLGVIYTEYFFVLLYYSTTMLQKKFLNKMFMSVLIAISTIALSRCRSAYLSIFSSIIFFYIKERKYLISISKRFKRIVISSRILKVLIICFIAMMIFTVIPRIYLSFNTFFDSGAYYGRQELITIAVSMIRQNILFGVGTKMFIPAAFSYFPGKDSLLSFPEEVHNGFLLMLSENGIFSCITFLYTYILYIYLLQQKLIVSSLKKSIIIASIISSCIIMIFLPYMPILPLPIIFLLAEYNSLYEKSRKI